MYNIVPGYNVPVTFFDLIDCCNIYSLWKGSFLNTTNVWNKGNKKKFISEYWFDCSWYQLFDFNGTSTHHVLFQEVNESHSFYVYSYFLFSCFLIFFCTGSYRIRIILNKPIWPINETLKVATTRVQNGPGSIGKEGVFYTIQRSRTEA